MKNVRQCMFKPGLPTFLALLLLASATGCHKNALVTGVKLSETDQTVAQRTILIGRWYGEAKTTEGETRMWIAERHPDGSFQIDFKLIDAQHNETNYSEIGIWGVSGGIYFTATRGFIDTKGTHPSDVTDPAFYDTYLINKLNNQIFEYQSMSTGSKFRVKKITPLEGFPRN